MDRKYSAREGGAPTATGGTPDEPGAPSLAATEMMTLLTRFGKTLLWLMLIYLTGYFGLSVSFLVFGLMLWMGWKMRRESKQNKLRDAFYLLENEENVTRKRTNKSLPAWINFQDLERADWLNKVLQQAWPFVGQYLEKLLVNSIAPIIRSSNNHLQTFAFTKVSFGVKPLKIHGVQVHTGTDKRQVTLDLHISYIGDCEINVEVKKYFCKAGVNGIQLHGMLRVILEPLIGQMPLVGAVTLFFVRRPVLDINWTGLTNLLDIPGLSSKSDTVLMDTIASFLVLPNRITCPLVGDLHVAELRSPLPRGIVRIYLIEAASLESKDTYVKGFIKGKSDPYAIVRVGTQAFMSKTISETVNPKWNEMYEVIVHEVPGQLLEIEMFDKDPDQDDFLGRMQLDLGEVMKNQTVEEWFTLKDVERGKVRLKLEWLSLYSDPAKLEQALMVNNAIAVQNSEEPSAAIMVVYVDQAQDLPLKQGTREPNALVQVSLLDKTFESRTVYNTNAPVWEDAFTFFVQNPNQQDLDIQVKDDDRQFSLGSLSIPLSQLLVSPDMSFDQWFPLEHSGRHSQIYLKIIMRVLIADTVDLEKLPRTRKSTLEKNIGSAKSDKMNVTAAKLVEAAGVGSLIQAPLPTESSAPSSVGTEGVIRIHLLEAENLIAKDNFMKGIMKGKSDPYVKVRAGAQSFRSKTIKENLNPKWHEMYEVIVNHVPGQELEFELFDKDVDKDDFLGRLKISYKDIMNSKIKDEWFMLNDVKSGKLHLKLEWLPPGMDALLLDQVLQANRTIFTQNELEPSAAILTVYLDRAHDLPMKKGKKHPSPVVHITVNGTSYKSQIINSTELPIWEESFSFLVGNPNLERMELQVKDDSHVLGTLTLPLCQLLTSKNLTLDKWFKLENSGPSSQIMLKVMLGILVSEHSRELFSIQSMAQDPASCEVENVSFLPSASDESELKPVSSLANDPSNHSVSDNSVPNSESVSSELDLRQRMHRKMDILESPQIKLTLQYHVQQGKLLLVVHSCRNLKLHSKEIPDPYVSLILLPDKNRVTKRKTSIKKKTINPDYNDKFEFEISLEEAQKRKLELTVKNSVSFMSREIGKLHFDLSPLDLTQEITQWFDLKEE
ncbi:extended synaptotagmin-1 isoform X1 [Stegostoma tigrinum]|uniref:extended synaptotagmin-1 isoform X1 n=2 Tax=Stegostoma tigrinum TaxID=3053191 RepID=UPI00202B5AF3|nr:extended synaptotagmin-1 isoform X1 [Stegostoma tigrinum]